MNTSSREIVASGPVSFALTLLLACAPECVHAGEAPKVSPFLSPESRTTYEKRVLPFLKQHCWKCHDESSAKAGFRVDDLGTDFLAGKTADRWREAIDQINLGKMPKSKAKPDAKEAFVIVEWVNQEIRNAERRAQSTGGRTPMRRLNRTEYANTVRDLFHLDEHLARKIEQELPADGKVDGFDRGGAALFIDKSQLQAYLDMAELIVREALPSEPVKANKFRLLALEDNNLLRRSPKTTTTMQEVLDRGDIHFSDLLAKEKRPLPDVERGLEPFDLNIQRDGGIEIVAAWPPKALAATRRGKSCNRSSSGTAGIASGSVPAPVEAMASSWSMPCAFRPTTAPSRRNCGKH
jgi:hypothetical protein